MNGWDFPNRTEARQEGPGAQQRCQLLGEMHQESRREESGGHGQQGHGCGVGGIAVQPGAGAEEAGVRREEKAGFLQEEGVET